MIDNMDIAIMSWTFWSHRRTLEKSLDMLVMELGRARNFVQAEL